MIGALNIIENSSQILATEYSEDRQLVQAISENNRAAISTLYNSYKGLFYTIASRYTSNTQEAEDHVREAFVQIYRKASTFRFKGSFEGWMKRILINICLTSLRKNKIKLDGSLDVMDEKNIFSIKNWSIEQLTAEEILASINELPLGYKTVLNLNVLEGFSHKEIGEQLGITESASRSQLTKARSRLRDILQQKELIE